MQASAKALRGSVPARIQDPEMKKALKKDLLELARMAREMAAKIK